MAIRWARRLRLQEESFRFSKETWPCCGRRTPLTTLRREDFPEPLGPRRPRNSPGSRVKVTFLTTHSLSYRKERSRASTRCMLAPFPPQEIHEKRPAGECSNHADGKFCLAGRHSGD